MSHTWINFKELRSRLTFELVLRHYNVQAKVKGDRATALCPLPGHPIRTDGKRTPSLSMNLARNIYRCFGCQSSGNAVEFAARMEGFDPSDPQQFRAAAVKLTEVFKISTAPPRQPSAKSLDARHAAKPAAPPESLTLVNSPLDFELKDLDPEHPRLCERGFLPETIRLFGLGYCNRGLMKSRIAIPLHDSQGRLVGYAGRIISDSMISDVCPKYRFPGDRLKNGMQYQFRKSLLLYNYHRIQAPVNDLAIVEGFASTFWLHQWGYLNVVAVMGSDCSDEQGELVASLTRPAGRVWVFTDGDPAGEQCAASCLSAIAHHRWCRWVRLAAGQPTDCTPADLEDMLWPL